MWPDVNPQHRKIISYRKTELDDPSFDVLEGHGTSIAGCIAGDALPDGSDDESVEQVRCTARQPVVSITSHSDLIPTKISTAGRESATAAYSPPFPSVRIWRPNAYFPAH
jgi:hypothetical protein